MTLTLQQYLGVDYFVVPPPSLTDLGLTTGYGIPAFRFPDWMYCPTCKRLAPGRKFGFVAKPRCERCRVRLVPSRFVVACKNGHLDDFPYEWWVHRGKCRGERQPELFIEMKGEKSTLESIIIRCSGCDMKCERSMAGSFGNEALKGMKCNKQRPWLRDRDPSSCDEVMRTMQRGATNLHFAVTSSALSIPPWSQQIQVELGKVWAKLRPLINDRNTFLNVVSAWNLPKKCGCTAVELLEEAKRKLDHGSLVVQKSWREILEGEYSAFLRGSADEKGEFKTKMAGVPEFAGDYVDEVVQVLRLREVLALRGFKRITNEWDIDDRSSFNLLSRDVKNWLPAIELRGEGIFLKLNQSKIQEWEDLPEVRQRYSYMLAHAERRSVVRIPNLSIRYVILHTLSHLLIRQLILQCGYSSASIKERIYSTFSDDNSLDMAGVLLYTASNDSEGSLGGLVREGEPARLDNTFRQMLEASSWCSADPLCIQSSGQGLEALNVAACHSCTLLPETSCEARNCFLDRAAIVGSLDNSSLGLFSPLLSKREV
ncbi:MAG: DUF1998 domain-containing protein [Syntrophomonadaceae bacterium]|nr:DUF1998 domain-containing protein [Syntrophomonadaceae bacterium]